MKKPVFPKFFLRTKTRLEQYTLHSEKISESSEGIRIELLSDYHGGGGPNEEERTLSFLKKRNPDMILITGDLVNGSSPETIPLAEQFLMKLLSIAPVYYAPGNHETKMSEQKKNRPAFCEYWNRITEAGVHTLRNEAESLEIRGSHFKIHGLELGLPYYKKPFSRGLKKETLEKVLVHQRDSYEILLAHSPKYGKTYFSWEPDLILSGHYHGGFVRLTRRTGLISPQFRLFPPYCCGNFSQGKTQMIVSAGMGEHTIPIRILNPRVVVEIDLLPLEKEPEIQ